MIFFDDADAADLGLKSTSSTSDGREEKDDDGDPKTPENEDLSRRKQRCDGLIDWVRRVATGKGRLMINKDSIIDDQVKLQEEELERMNREMCLRFRIITAEGEAYQPRRGARGKEKAFRAAGLHDFTLVDNSDKMFSSPMTRTWAPAKPAEIKVGDEHQAIVPEFDEAVANAILENLHKFTEKETQMLGSKFWPPNNEDDESSPVPAPTKGNSRKRLKSYEPEDEQLLLLGVNTENAAKRIAPNVIITTKEEEEDVGSIGEAKEKEEEEQKIIAVVEANKTYSEMLAEENFVTLTNDKGQEEVIKLVRVSLEDVEEARAQLKREIGDSLDIQTSFGLHDMGIVVENQWSDEEREIFAKHVRKNCDNLRPMKALLPFKTMSQIVSYYYNVWQTTTSNPRRVDIWHPPEEKRPNWKERKKVVLKATAAEKRQKQRAKAVAPEIILKEKCRKEFAQMLEWIRSTCATNPRQAAYNANRAETVTKLRSHMIDRIHGLRLKTQDDKDNFEDYKSYFHQRISYGGGGGVVRF